MKTNQKKKVKQSLFILATITCILAETQRQTEEEESFIVEKREGFRCALIRSCWHGEAVSSLIRSRVF